MAQEPITEPARQAEEKLLKKIDAKVAQLKKIHKTVHVLRITEIPAVEVTDSDPYVPGVVKVAYLKPVTRTALSMATAVAGSDSYKFNEIVMRECWLEGDMEIQTDDALFLNAMRFIDSLIEFKQGEIKKY